MMLLFFTTANVLIASPRIIFPENIHELFLGEERTTLWGFFLMILSFLFVLYLWDAERKNRLLLRRTRRNESEIYHLDRRMGELTQIAMIGRILTSSLEFRRCAQALAEAILNLIGGDRCSIMLWNAEKRCLEIVGSSGRYGLQPGERGGKIAERVFQTRESLLLDGETKDRSLQRIMRDPKGIRASLCVPLTIEERAIGVLSLVRFTEQPFTEADRELLQIFAHEAALCIEKSRTRRRLREYRAHYESIFEQASDAIFIHTPEGRIVDVNQRALALTGLSSKELIGICLFDLCEAEGREHSRRQIQKTLSEGRASYETKIRRGDGRIRDIEISQSSIHLEGKAHCQSIARDITDSRAMQWRLFQNEKMNSIASIAGGMAHNFNNYLTSIMGNASMMMDVLPEADLSRRYASAIEKAARDASQLVQDLMTFSHRRERIPEILQLNALVDEALNLLKATFPGGIVLEARLEKPLPTVWGDENQLKQALINIIINAQEAMPHGGTLTVETRRVGPEERPPHAPPEECVVVSVSDTGKGMTDEEKERIFDPFFSTKKAGNGLGLSTVYSIVEAHGGVVRVASERGVGTTFEVYLPAGEGKA